MTASSAPLAFAPGELSIVIPVGPGDDAWRLLLDDLRQCGVSAEIVLVGCEPAPADWAAITSQMPVSLRWLTSARGRALQQNLGGRSAGGRWLWFLHADTRVTPDAVAALQRSIRTHADCLHYFLLRFADGPRAMKLNEWGLAFRSRWLGMPFGDQGLCLQRSDWERLGGFAEAAPYGEDHLLVWHARRAGIRLHWTGAWLTTSARKYQARGWLRTTWRHGWLTWRQAAPQFWAWLWRK